MPTATLPDGCVYNLTNDQVYAWSSASGEAFSTYVQRVGEWVSCPGDDPELVGDESLEDPFAGPNPLDEPQSYEDTMPSEDLLDDPKSPRQGGPLGVPLAGRPYRSFSSTGLSRYGRMRVKTIEEALQGARRLAVKKLWED